MSILDVKKQDIYLSGPNWTGCLYGSRLVRP